MPREPRLLLEDRPTVYHVMSHTALEGYPIGSQEKECLVSCLRQHAKKYFIEIIGFCFMDNHFHLLLRALPATHVEDDEVLLRYRALHGDDAKISPVQLRSLKQQWCSLSRYMQELKQSFSRYYNKRHSRRGYFWSDRYKNVILEEGRTLVNCLAYIDLNPMRAGLVSRPDDYR